MSDVSIERIVIESEQPILFIRRRVSPGELQQAMGECFGELYLHGQMAGLAIAGWHRFAASSRPDRACMDGGFHHAAGGARRGERRHAARRARIWIRGLQLSTGGLTTRWGKPAQPSERWIEEQGFEASGPPWQS